MFMKYKIHLRTQTFFAVSNGKLYSITKILPTQGPYSQLQKGYLPVLHCTTAMRTLQQREVPERCARTCFRRNDFVQMTPRIDDELTNRVLHQ